MSNPYIFDYCPRLNSLYHNRKTVGRSGKVFNGLAALSTVNNLIIIRALMLKLKPKRTLEIGMAFGGSTLMFAATHKGLGNEPEQQHTAVDPAQNIYWDNAGIVNLESASLNDYVELIEEYSSLALPKLVGKKRKYGMVYIDGSHQFEDVLLDFFYTHEMLDVNGLILFDDSTDSHVAKVLSFIEANYSEIYKPLSLKNFKSGFRDRVFYSLASYLRKTQLRVYRKIKEGRQNWGKPLKNF